MNNYHIKGCIMNTYMREGLGITNTVPRVPLILCQSMDRICNHMRMFLQNVIMKDMQLFII